MSRRITPSRLTLASRRLQARIRQENAAAAPKAVAFSPHAPIDLDALEAAARKCLRLSIDDNVQRHSQQIARDSAALQTRFHACLNRRNDRARLILKHFNDEKLWRGLIPLRCITGDAP